MRCKLKVETMVRVEFPEGTDVTQIKEVVRKYLQDGKFILNKVEFVVDYDEQVSG